MRRWLSIALALAALLAGACAGEDDPAIRPPANGDCEDHTGDDGGHVDMVDNEFDPTCLVVSADAPLELTNSGDAEHTFTIDTSDVDAELEPGASETVGPPSPLDPGEYAFYCRYHGSPDGSGMAGTITVEG